MWEQVRSQRKWEPKETKKDMEYTEKEELTKQREIMSLESTESQSPPALGSFLVL
jgi:hypothetical protein